ncbi:hypothetical protein ACT8ZS_02120 [Paenibacillus sp. M.A.Huq-84]
MDFGKGFFYFKNSLNERFYQPDGRKLGSLNAGTIIEGKETIAAVGNSIV